MKSVRTVLFLFLVVFNGASSAATTRSDVIILEAAGEIKFISQKIVKDYFYFAQHKEKNSQLSSYLNKTLDYLDKQIIVIATATKSSDTKDLLTFLAFSSEQIRETISQPYNEENAALMLDYSETLLEGSESIFNEHRYAFSKEEQMLIKVKNMGYYIERITKYYMAFQAGFTDLNNIRQLNMAVSSFDKALEELKMYAYEDESKKSFITISHFWGVVRDLYLNIEKRKLPNILNLSTLHLKEVLTTLEVYHSKNQ